MARIKDRQKAIELRMKGRSYSQIKSELGISKSTLHYWLRDYPLTKAEVYALQHSDARIEKYRETMQKKRNERMYAYYKEQKKKLLPLSRRELFVAGLFLYWGEGAKSDRNTVYINNTDPSVLKFALVWMTKSLNILKDDIHITLHLYNDMNIEEEINFWSNELKMPRATFDRPYIKQSQRININHKGFGHGTCGLRVYNTAIKEPILMAIKATADYYNDKVIEL